MASQSKKSQALTNRALDAARICASCREQGMKSDLVCPALKSAYWRLKLDPELIQHSDRGSSSKHSVPSVDVDSRFSR